jgi:hypothetical protein
MYPRGVKDAPRRGGSHANYSQRALMKRNFQEEVTSRIVAELEQNPTNLNRKGFPSGSNSDSHCVLGREASTHGQAFIGGFADQSDPSG